MAFRTALYPPIEAFDTRRVAVDAIHTLHVEQSGNPKGVPVVFLHGGPGSAWPPDIRRFFDPDHYRLVAFDQRGSWRSTPLGELEANTPRHLVQDIEHLRALFGIERWIVFGGSWGSTLALAYAEAHPDRCLGLVVRGVSLGHGLCDGWYFEHSRWVRPAAWHALMSVIPEAERDRPEAALVRLILDPDPAVHMPAVKAWDKHAHLCGASRRPDPEITWRLEDPAVERAAGRIAAVYMHRYGFADETGLLENAHRLKGVPGAIVQGEDDFNCPPIDAWELHRAWPEADYVPVPNAGHSSFDIGIREALVAAMEKLKTLR
jgi:proline iminopeptidase